MGFANTIGVVCRYSDGVAITTTMSGRKRDAYTFQYWIIDRSPMPTMAALMTR